MARSPPSARRARAGTDGLRGRSRAVTGPARRRRSNGGGPGGGRPISPHVWPRGRGGRRKRRRDAAFLYKAEPPNSIPPTPHRRVSFCSASPRRAFSTSAGSTAASEPLATEPPRRGERMGRGGIGGAAAMETADSTRAFVKDVKRIIIKVNEWFIHPLLFLSLVFLIASRRLCADADDAVLFVCSRPGDW